MQGRVENPWIAEAAMQFAGLVENVAMPSGMCGIEPYHMHEAAMIWILIRVPHACTYVLIRMKRQERYLLLNFPLSSLRPSPRSAIVTARRFAPSSTLCMSRRDID